MGADGTTGDQGEPGRGEEPALVGVVATVVDVVGSREHPDQARLLDGVAARVQRVLVEEGTATSAGASVGDEFQALHVDVGSAVRDLTRLRLSLVVDPPGDRPVDVRAGLGLGDVLGDGDATARSQSGSAWWRAREALDEAGRRRNGWPATRWWVVGAGVSLPAALLALDTIASSFDPDDHTAALRLLDGDTAAEIARSLQVVPSTLSARLHTHGVYGFVRTVELLASGRGRP